ncbi:MAG: DUF1343 domain-containing protein [Sulfolobales archaeon]
MILGVDLFLGEGLWRSYSNKRIAILTNASGVTSNLTYTVEELLARGLKLEGVLVPEHGFWTFEGAGEVFKSYYDDYLGVPVLRFYGSDYDEVRRSLENVDVVIVDIQDLGLRFYTYISAVIDLIDIFSDVGGSEILILDRPNPLGGIVLEGPIARDSLRSYISRYSIPVRYGATIGELSRLYAYEKSRDIDIKVIPVRGWRRSDDILDIESHWIPPSPAIPTPDTVFAYASTVYLEPTNISEGRGSYTPFKIFGAPFIDPRKLAEELNKRIDPDIVRFRPLFFKPQTGKHAEKICGGVFMHIIRRNRKRYKAFNVGLIILRTLYELYESQIILRKIGDLYGIDFLIGDIRAREVIFGRKSLEEYLEEIETEIKAYEERLKPFIMYK